MNARIRLVLLASALSLTLTACGGGSDTASPEKTPAASAAADGGDFCEQLDQARGSFELMNISLATDWSAFEGASKQLAAVEPPTAIAADWKVAADFYAYIAGLFEDVDFSDRKAVGAAIQSNLGPETEARAKKAEASIAEVEAYAKDTCQDTDDATPAAVTDACTLLKDDELKRVFPTGVPAPKSRTYAANTKECIWKTDAAEASIMIAPLAEFKSEYLDKSTPLSTGEIDGLEGGNTFKGILGIGRFNTKGHSVSFTLDEVGGFVSVRHGEGDSRPADVGTASTLAKLVVSRLKG